MVKIIKMECFACSGQGNTGFDEQHLPYTCYKCCGTGFREVSEVQNQIDILEREILDANISYNNYYEMNGQLDPEVEAYCSAADYMTHEELEAFEKNSPPTRIQRLSELKERNLAKIAELKTLLL